ncbi:tetratricopeptide repeat protein [Kurthia sibirica]|uniref:Transcriptional regulator n=1 Tax=Kurthia sibirica TaxID=202750 RepID=A0A2U3AJB0_9BACL|nr:tetratricopeptide repeat protein [Kurthia sibirica]PWI24617.1 transcriptional regulator [Kurthia sibirica]GEK33445.1 TPR repeat-containing protein YvcD [Kurthia sibirica]
MENKSQKPIKPNIVSFLPTGDFYYEKALKCLERGNVHKAMTYLQRASELSPNDAMILLQYAVVELELGNTDKARTLLLEADTLQARHPEIVLFLAETSATLGYLEDAIHYGQLYLEIDDEGDFYEEALEIIDFSQSILDEMPKDIDEPAPALAIEQEKARTLMESGQHEKAIELFENIIADHPDYWAAYNNLALAYFYQGEGEQARALLHEVLLGNYGNLHALCNLTVIAYYEQEKEELALLLETLVKLHPYNFEHRFKLGATLALVGKYDEAYKWLKSLYTKGYIGDTGFYFWLAHSAYFAGHDRFAEDVWKQLIEMDPSKAGFEPWSTEALEEDEILNDRDFIVGKLEHDYSSERLLGLYLLSKTPYKQEIISHPKIVDVDRCNHIEKIFLAYALGHELQDDAALAPILRALEVAEILYKDIEPMKIEDTFLFQMWFMLCDRALAKGYTFKNPIAHAAAAEYMYKSSRMKITKKSVADYYGITSQTLTKYINELMPFLPMFDR